MIGALSLSVSLLLSVPRVDVAEFSGPITPVSSEFLTRAIERSEAEGSELLVIALDTPGGLDESMRDVVKEILTASIPVCVFVYPPGGRAASAGVFITLAAHVAAMAPGTNIGAAHPVSLGGQIDSTMVEKVTNDAVAYIRSIAEKRGRDADWAEEAVRQSVSISAREAVDRGVVEIFATHLGHLLEQLQGREVELEGGTHVLNTEDAEVRRIKMGLRERLLAALANPNIAYILFILGFYGIFFELSHPGSIFPGVVGAICLILAFYAFQTLSVNYAGVLLIVLAMGLFIAELKIQSNGILGLGGGVAMILGSLMLFQSGSPFLRVSWVAIGAVVAVTLLFFFVVIAKGLRAQLRRTTTGREGLVGEIGIVKRKVDPRGGVILIHGELWAARSDVEIEEGEEVEVTEVSGLTLRVKPGR
jgi:membrane-bound serine protease (ClpP class)